MEIHGGVGRMVGHGIIRFHDLSHPFYSSTKVVTIPSDGHVSLASYLSGQWNPLRQDFDGNETKTFTPPVSYWGGTTDHRTIRHSVPTEFKHSDHLDAARFGSYLGNVGRAFAILSDDKRNKLRFQKENNVRHGTTSGELLHPNTTDYVVNRFKRGVYDTQLDSINVTCPNTLGPDKELLSSPTDSYFQLIEWEEFWTALRLHYQGIPQPIKYEAWGSYERIFSFTKPVNVSLNSDGHLEVSYELLLRVQNATTPDEVFTEALHAVRHVLRWEGHEHTEPNGMIYDNCHDHYYSLTPYILENWLTVHSIRTEGSPPYGPYEAGYQYVETACWFMPTSYAGSSGDIDQEVIDYVIDEYQALDRLVLINMEDIYGAAYVAGARAVKDHRTILETNYLESITELREVLSLIPDTGPLQDFLRLLPRGKLLAGTLRLADFAANTYLLYKFGLQTAESDIREFAENYDRIAARLRDILRTNHDLRGKFTYTFSDNSSMAGFTLVVRSKVVITFPRDGVSLALLPFEATGVSLTPGNLWDLMPFSFVVDWFTNNSERWALGENAVHALLAQTHYCVHSFSLHRNMDFSHPPNGYYYSTDAEYKYYIRLKSSFFPSPSSSKYDWLAVKHSPPKLVGGALLWSLVRRG